MSESDAIRICNRLNEEHAILLAEVERLKEENEQLKKKNTRSEKENEQWKHALKEAREERKSGLWDMGLTPTE